MTYKYRIRSLGFSSERYGNCEICGKHCSEVFYQAESKKYKRDLPDGTTKTGYTHHNCHDFFGHKECLESQRKQA